MTVYADASFHLAPGRESGCAWLGWAQTNHRGEVVAVGGGAVLASNITEAEMAAIQLAASACPGAEVVNDNTGAVNRVDGAIWEPRTSPGMRHAHAVAAFGQRSVVQEPWAYRGKGGLRGYEALLKSRRVKRKNLWGGR